MGSYEETLLNILEPLTCPRCKEIFNSPVTLDCGDSVCSACAEKIGSKNEAAQRCCCPKCGAESVTEDLLSRINWTLSDVASVVRGHTAFPWKGLSAPESCSAGDSGVGDMESEYYVGSSCSIRSMPQPPTMASTRESFNRMSRLTHGLKSENELSQRSFGSSDCGEREQWPEDEASARRPLSGSGGLFESKLPQQNGLASSSAPSTDLLTHTTSDGTQTSVYKTGWYEQALLEILKPLTCPHCKEILTFPVTLDCGHSVCFACAGKIGSENEEGQRCCCCPKCGAESVRKYFYSRINWTLWDVVFVARVHAASLGFGLRTPEACSAGDSGRGDIMSTCSVRSSCSIGTMDPPPDMLTKGELFDRMFLVTDGVESEVELWHYTEKEQRHKNKASARRAVTQILRKVCRPERSKRNLTVPVTLSMTHDL